MQENKMTNKKWFQDVSKEVVEEKKPTKRLTVDVDKDLHNSFKAYCVSSDTSMASIVSTLIENHLKINNVKL
jgi:hypothetical protein